MSLLLGFPLGTDDLLDFLVSDPLLLLPKYLSPAANDVLKYDEEEEELELARRCILATILSAVKLISPRVNDSPRFKLQYENNCSFCSA